MTIQTILPVDRSRIQAISEQNHEPDWMSRLRLEALELAGRLDLPKLEKTRIDRWNLGAMGTYQPPQKVDSLNELSGKVQQMLQTGEETSNLLVHRNSGNVFARLDQKLADQGVIFTDMETAMQKHADLIKPYFMSAVKKDENRLTALHAAAWTGGVFLYVPKNVELEMPLQALLVADQTEAAFAPHVLIVAEANSKVTYVDNYFSEKIDGELVHNGVVEIFVKAGARVTFASVHDFQEGVTDISYRRAVLEQDGRMDWIIGEMSSGNGMSDTTSLLQGGGTFSDATVICVGTRKQQLNISTRAVHVGRNSTSDMITRAVMKDEATAIINGITKIEKGATDANGQQTEKVLMLSPGARGDANPMLLIDEDEVKAGHAASVGKVDPAQIYYLMSRGISREQATRLVIYGFLAPVVSKIPIAKLEEQLQLLVERKLG